MIQLPGTKKVIQIVKFDMRFMERPNDVSRDESVNNIDLQEFDFQELLVQTNDGSKKKL